MPSDTHSPSMHTNTHTHSGTQTPSTCTYQIMEFIFCERHSYSWRRSEHRTKPKEKKTRPRCKGKKPSSKCDRGEKVVFVVLGVSAANKLFRICFLRLWLFFFFSFAHFGANQSLSWTLTHTRLMIDVGVGGAVSPCSVVRRLKYNVAGDNRRLAEQRNPSEMICELLKWEGAMIQSNLGVDCAKRNRYLALSTQIVGGSYFEWFKMIQKTSMISITLPGSGLANYQIKFSSLGLFDLIWFFSFNRFGSKWRGQAHDDRKH